MHLIPIVKKISIIGQPLKNIHSNYFAQKILSSTWKDTTTYAKENTTLSRIFILFGSVKKNQHWNSLNFWQCFSSYFLYLYILLLLFYFGKSWLTFQVSKIVLWEIQRKFDTITISMVNFCLRYLFCYALTLSHRIAPAVL